MAGAFASGRVFAAWALLAFSSSESFLSNSTALTARSTAAAVNFTLSLLASQPPFWMGGPDAPEMSISRYVPPKATVAVDATLSLGIFNS